MRSIDEIKKNLKHAELNLKACLHEDGGLVSHAQWDVDRLELELFHAIKEYIPLDRLEQICNAERLIGKLVYKLTTDSPNGYEETPVKRVILTKNTVKIYAKCIYDNWGNAQWEFTLKDIGKTAFLTKEQVEAKLNEMEELK